VRRGLPAIEEAFALDPHEREAVLAGMARWETTGDAPDLDRDELLDCIPRLHRRAADLGLGVASCFTVAG
jgi:hypothetical protein